MVRNYLQIKQQKEWNVKTYFVTCRVSSCLSLNFFADSSIPRKRVSAVQGRRIQREPRLENRGKV